MHLSRTHYLAGKCKPYNVDATGIRTPTQSLTGVVSLIDHQSAMESCYLSLNKIARDIETQSTLIQEVGTLGPMLMGALKLKFGAEVWC